MNTVSKKGFSFENRVWLLLTIILVIVTASGLFVYKSLSDIVNGITEEARPDETVILMKEMIYDLADAENSVKSYSLTNEAPYLDMFNAKFLSLEDKMDRLRELTESQPATRRDVDLLDSLISEKFVVLEDLLILRGQFRVNEALDKVVDEIEASSRMSNSVSQPVVQKPNPVVAEEKQEKEDKFFKRLFNKRKNDKDEEAVAEDMTEEPVTVQPAVTSGITIEEINAEVSQVKYEESLINRSDKEKELFLIQEDKRIMDEITTIFSRMEKNETLNMEEKLAFAEDQSTRTNILIAVFCILACTLLFLAGYAVSRYIKRDNEFKKALNKARLETEMKNREITDSILYAQRIQEAILPDTALVKSYLRESFVLYKPKDIVAGDFYWTVKVNDTVYVAVADCTGHGVPGAMVSVVCNNALNRSVREFGLTKPAEILEKCRDLVIETFAAGNHNINDGMDIALVAFRQLSGNGHGVWSIEYAGANNSIYVLKDGQLKEVAADKQPIGKYQLQQSFTNHELTLEEGSLIYLFSDGIADQFGGPAGKKLKYQAFQELLIANSIHEMELQRRNLDFAFENWKGDLEQVDDVCVIGVRV